MAVNKDIYIGIGSNLAASGYADPAATVLAAFVALEAAGIPILRQSSLWASPAWPPPASGEARQPDFVNAVVAARSDLDPDALLTLLHAIEAGFGRRRLQRWEARTLDLDLLDHGGLVRQPAGRDGAVLPHPALAGRLFVLLPLEEVAPDWRHPVTQAALPDLIRSAESMEISRLA